MRGPNTLLVVEPLISVYRCAHTSSDWMRALLIKDFSICSLNNDYCQLSQDRFIPSTSRESLGLAWKLAAVNLLAKLFGGLERSASKVAQLPDKLRWG